MKKHLSLIVGGLLTLGFTACTKDYFDKEAYAAARKAALGIENLDPTHTWATVGSAKASITVNMNTDEIYRIKIYDQNPIGSNTALSLLAEGTVSNGGKLDLSFNYKLAQPYAYVTLFDSKNFMSVYPQLMENGNLDVQIGTAIAQPARRRAGIEPHFTFASAPSDADFKTSVPDGCLLPNAYGNNTKDQVHNYQLAETTDKQQLNFYNGNFNLYVTGTKTVSFINPGGGSKNMVFYILPGADLTFADNNFDLNAGENGNFRMYVCEGAKVTFAAGLQSYMELYNRGTIEVKGGYKPGIYGPGMFFNEGTFTVNGAQSYYSGMNISNPLTLNNQTSQFINVGTLNVGGVVVAGSAHFINYGTVTATDATIVNSNQATWVNDGTYTTGSFIYTAGSTDVINNCKLTCTEKFRINLGDTDINSFQLNGGASVVTKDFEAEGPTYIKMGSNSLFQVTNTAKFYIAKDVYGIYGPSTGDYAVFQAKTIERLFSWQTNQGFTANYFGHLWVATDNHFNFGYSDVSQYDYSQGKTGAQPYYRLDAATGAKMTTYNGANVTLSDAGCGSAYSGMPVDKIPESKDFSMRYCFEDKFPDFGDYDFNDVVMTVTPTVNGSKLRLKVSIDAVGATKSVSAAIRLVGVQNSDIKSWQALQGFEPLPDNMASLKNIDTNETFLPEYQAPNNSNSVVIVLFQNAHWAIKPHVSYAGSPLNYFYNTVQDTYYPTAMNVEPKEAIYELEFWDDEKVRSLTESNYDVFIVEPYNGSPWEVHTVQNGFKTDQVVTPLKDTDYEDNYGDNTPWAIMTPGNDFKYPIEWQNIGQKKGGVLTGVYKQEGHAFANWAEDPNTNQDWYLYPTSGLVYE